MNITEQRLLLDYIFWFSNRETAQICVWVCVSEGRGRAIAELLTVEKVNLCVLLDFQLSFRTYQLNDGIVSFSRLLAAAVAIRPTMRISDSIEKMGKISTEKRILYEINCFGSVHAGMDIKNEAICRRFWTRGRERLWVNWPGNCNRGGSAGTRNWLIDRSNQLNKENRPRRPCRSGACLSIKRPINFRGILAGKPGQKRFHLF